MKTIDIRLKANSIHILQNMVGKCFIKYRCDPMAFNNWVYERLGIYVDDITAELTNTTTVLDYFGDIEDVCVLNIEPSTDSEIHSGLADTSQVDVLVKEQITSINIVQENQRLLHDNVPTYDVYLTRGIIFKLTNGNEISFEKTSPFSAEIAICQGRNLIAQFQSEKNISTDWDAGYHMQVSREIVFLQ